MRTNERKRRFLSHYGTCLQFYLLPFPLIIVSNRATRSKNVILSIIDTESEKPAEQ